MKIEQNKIVPADCPERFTHRGLVGTGLACQRCGTVIPAGPFADWSVYGIVTFSAPPSTAILPSNAEQDALAESDKEMALRENDLRAANRIRTVDIPKLHELTGYTRDGEGIQRNYDNARERELYEKIQDLENSAEKHRQKAQVAKVRAGNQSRERDSAWRRDLAAR